MAYSSMHPFLGRVIDATKKRNEGSMKRYESTIDTRAWAIDKIQQSAHIRDAITRYEGQDEIANGSRQDISNNELTKQIEHLLKDIKAKDAELDKIHKLFKQTMRKLERMDDALKISKNDQSQLADSKERLNEIKDQHREQENALKSIREELESLRCNSAQSLDIETERSRIRNREKKLEEFERERNAMKDQLCRMAGAEDLLRKLKKRADEADLMEQEISQLKRELQKSGKNQYDKHPAVSETTKVKGCPVCENSSDALENSKAVLDAEIRRSNEIEAERNFLREKARTIDVMEAELILYKTKYEEYSNKLMELKETVVKADSNERQLNMLSKRLRLTECQLLKCEEHAGQLTNIVERKEIELHERDVYISAMPCRLATESQHIPTHRAISYDNITIEKAQLEAEIARLKVEIKLLKSGDSLMKIKTENNEPGSSSAESAASDIATPSVLMEISESEDISSVPSIMLEFNDSVLDCRLSSIARSKSIAGDCAFLKSSMCPPECYQLFVAQADSSNDDKKSVQLIMTQEKSTQLESKESCSAENCFYIEEDESSRAKAEFASAPNQGESDASNIVAKLLFEQSEEFSDEMNRLKGEVSKLGSQMKVVSQEALNHCRDNREDRVPPRQSNADNEIEIRKTESLIVGRFICEENENLHDEIKRLRCELNQVTEMLDEMDKQRQTNSELQQELESIQDTINNEVHEISSFCRESLKNKDEELKAIEYQLNIELENAHRLERQITNCCKELEELRPLSGVRESVDHLTVKLRLSELMEAERAKDLECSKSECSQYYKENCKMLKHIRTLEATLDEQRIYAKNLADQLNVRKSNLADSSYSSIDQRDSIRAAIRELKISFDSVRSDKLKLIQCYEQKIASLKAENQELKSFREKVIAQKNCKEQGKCDCTEEQHDGDILLEKLTKFGFDVMDREELVELHNRVYYAIKKTGKQGINLETSREIRNFAKEMCKKYQLTDCVINIADNNSSNDQLDKIPVREKKTMALEEYTPQTTSSFLHRRKCVKQSRI